MSLELIGLLGIIALLFLISIGIPVGFSFIITGFFGILYLESLQVALSTFRMVPYRWVTSYALAPIVLFILMASIVSHGGAARDLYDAVNKWLGKVRGSLGIATVIACGAFAAVSGSSIATAAAMGKIAIPEMKKYNYDERLAAGCAAAGGTVGSLIPPSIAFIIYGTFVEESIAKLFIAGILPGILEIISYIIVILILVRLFPHWASISPSYSFREKLSSLAPIWAVIVLGITVMGGIYAGIFTPTEAGGIGATVAFLIALISGRMNKKVLLMSLMDAGRLSCAIFFIIIGAMIFSRFLAYSGTCQLVIELSRKYFDTQIKFIICMMIVYVILGCFMDVLPIIVLTIPITLPVLHALDINLIWYGVFFIEMTEIAEITPPVGLNLFTIRAVNPDIPSGKIIKGVTPFIVMDFIVLIFVILYPQISLFLPSRMG